MEPASYQIPLVVWPTRQRPWQRLYLTPTHSSAAHAHANPHNHAHDETSARDSLEWTLGSDYDHEKDLFRDKPSTMRRPGRDGRACQEAAALRGAWQEVTEALKEESQRHDQSRGSDRAGTSRPTPADTLLQPTLGQVGEVRPRVARVRAQDSLTTSLLYSPRPTHTLTVPKAAPGYARNPTGAFFTS
nr:uncharacterized protein LOC123771934 [Procambarus clarkii]